MFRTRALRALLLAMALVAAACGGDSESSDDAATENETASQDEGATEDEGSTDDADGGAETTTQDSAAPASPTAMDCSAADYAGEPATLSFVWWVGGGDSPSDVWVQDAIDCFQQRYEGSITLDIEFVPGQADYVDKFKVDYGAGVQLPPVVTLKRDPSLAQLWIDNDELIDLTPYFEADPDWQAISIEASRQLNTIDGRLVAAPDTFQTAIGIFYNTEMFESAGVDGFPEDWDGFFAALEAVQDAGFVPLSIHTDDTGWSTILIFEALLARTQEGRDFLNETFPSDFNQPFIIDAVEEMQRLFQFAGDEAVGGNYAIAANNFLNEQTAIMPNGPWMIGDFSDPDQAAEGFADKVGVALYPGAVAVDDTGLQLGDWAVTSGHSQVVTDAAVEFIKWMNSEEVVRQRVIRLGSSAPNLALSAEDLASLDPLASALIELVQVNNAPILPNYQGQWNTTIQNEVMVQELPQLALGNLTPEEFAQRLTDAAISGNP